MCVYFLLKCEYLLSVVDVLLLLFFSGYTRIHARFLLEASSYSTPQKLGGGVARVTHALVATKPSPSRRYVTLCACPFECYRVAIELFVCVCMRLLICHGW